MQRVNVTNRNLNSLCRRCSRKFGDVGKVAYTTVKKKARSASYCADCGPKMVSG